MPARAARHFFRVRQTRAPASMLSTSTSLKGRPYSYMDWFRQQVEIPRMTGSPSQELGIWLGVLVEQ